ncbi:arginine N-succinyltransferase [Pacificimonas sp. WHA3]|uniref:Arginine N-succinyltransferase n=1 Tax=Pacificimonas pallii TaxID=2827236 RepID=A0ABS6SB99_9SPHN|nr:arginine N-succinyltransferase [Pacificimonas pallii]MBV7255634.1 arginine N-succinyltransferase [Pacificimonas pallii]
MSFWFMRPARIDDVDAVMELAKLTGAGFTNLPPDRDSLAARLNWSDRSFAREDDAPQDELYMLLMEEAGTGRIGGSALLFSRLGVRWPFYSYRMSCLSQFSQELERTIRLDVLHLVNDFNDASEVGGLFLHPDLRTGGLGGMLARSRYLFIARHRQRFADRVIAELRGRIDENGHSPFWDGLGRQFFGMNFDEADTFNSLNGNQFIADLMPKLAIYTALLPEAAQAAIGQPHESGVPAMRMLEKEGFAYNGYVDIFDGGPTMVAATNSLRTIKAAQPMPVAAVTDMPDAERRGLAAAGQLRDFRAWSTSATVGENGLTLPSHEAATLNVTTGDTITHVAR